MENNEMSETIHHYTEQFSLFEKNGASKSPAWLHELRTNALAIFNDRGFPNSKEEDWRFTNISPITKTAFHYSSDSEIPVLSKDYILELAIQKNETHRLVFINGHFSKEHSVVGTLPHGAIVTNLSEALKNHSHLVQQYIGKYAATVQSSFTALNTAFIKDGAFIFVPSGVEVTEPIHLLFISTKTEKEKISNIRNLFIIEENAKAVAMEQFRGYDENSNLSNVVTEIIAKDQSSFELVKVQKESARSYHYENLYSTMGKESKVDIFSLALGSAIARNDMSGIIDGEAADLNLNGLYITDGDQLIDHHTLMHHIHPNCPSHELFKGILNGNSRAVFNGKVYVNPEAQKTDSKQTNRNLLLSENATINAKPELEIFADDVKCTHGAATGGLNPQSIFYLKSRGVSEETSKGILVVGFAAEVTAKIKNQLLRHYVDLIVVEHLQEHIGITNLPEIVHAQ